ncbi:MAG: NTP transferase domain-containing protein [Alphaproteobacteria bacterium]|nr:NTP transferase domain-containing protein [Alphaproteobacteria bacterium]
MKFDDISLDDALGTILAHSHRLGDRVLKKGHVLCGDDITQLSRAGVSRVIAAKLEDGDVGEDEAAARLASAIGEPGLKPTAPFTGRCNLVSEGAGLLVVDRDGLDRFNRVDESITVATLPPYSKIRARQMVATVKIIPFAVRSDALERCLEITTESQPLIRRQPYISHRIGLIQSRLSGSQDKLLDKTLDVLTARVKSLGATIEEEIRCRHNGADVDESVRMLLHKGCTMILIAGASAIVDRRDIVPASIERVGGTIEHFGMPVDPGNLLLLAHLGDVPVIGLPGCARSPKFNGLDIVLERLCAGLPITGRDIMDLGAGGLLKEMADRPQPRENLPLETGSEMPRVAAVVLAAGQSRRMGEINKLLAEIDGTPMVARVVDTASASDADPIVVVVGHEAELVRSVLGGRSLRYIENPDFADGLSSSLRAGIGALPDDVAAALICLGDMPRLTAPQLNRLIAAYDPMEGRAICVPTYRGKRGNPVLWDRRFFADMVALSGDVGARHLIGANAEVVVEVEMDDDAVLIDVDSPAALTALGKTDRR